MNDKGVSPVAPRHGPAAVLLAVALMLGHGADAAIRLKADNSVALNSTNSWVGLVAPGAADVAQWDSTVVNTDHAGLSGGVTWGTLAFADPAVAFSINVGSFITLNGLDGLGIDMSGATTNLTIGTGVRLGGPQRWVVAAGRTLTMGATGMSAEIESMAATNVLTKLGAGTLVLSGVSGNTGLAAPVQVFEGTLELNKDVGNVVAISHGGLSIGDPSLVTPPRATVRFTGASYNLIGSSSITINKTGVLDTNGKGEDGAGAVTLVGTNDTCGVFTNSAGGSAIVVVGSSLTFRGGGGIDLGTSVLQLNGNVLYTNVLNGQAAMLAGRVTLNQGTLTFTVADDESLPVDLRVSANVAGNNNLAKSGAGRMVLGGNNSYNGTTTVNSPGVLRITSTNALGTGSSTTVNTGGALELEGDLATISEPLTLNGTGLVDGGALRNVSGANVWLGSIHLNSAVRMNADAGLLVLAGGSVINSAQNLFVGGAGDVAIRRVLQTGARTLTKDGSGTLTLSATNTYSGGTLVTGGVLRVDGRLTGSRVRVADGGTLGGHGEVLLSVTNAAGGTLAPGGGFGALSLGALHLQSGCAINVEFDNITAANDQVWVTNQAGLVINGGVIRPYAAGSTNIWIPAAGAATCNLIRYTGSIGGTGVSALSVTNAHPAWHYHLDADDGWVRLNIVNQDFPVIHNASATAIGAHTATLNGVLASTGATATVVSVYWGVQDRTNDAAAWDNGHIIPGTAVTGAVSHVIDGLAGETTYYYRFAASNALGQAWASPVASVVTALSPADYAHRMQIVFTGYTRDEPLMNFPALLVLNAALTNGFSYSGFASPFGHDLRFQDATETVRLNHEVERWSADGDSLVWVQVPVFTGGCAIWAYWGNSNAVTPAAFTTNGATWDTPFNAVWHLADANAAGHLPDATANRRTGTNVVPAGVTATAAIIGEGRQFNGSSGYLNAGPVGIAGNAPRTLSGWAQFIQTGDSLPAFFGLMNPSADSAGTEFYVSRDFAPKLVLVRGGGGAANLDNFAAQQMDWMHYAATWDGASLVLYANGNPVAVNNAIGALQTVDRFGMGRQLRFGSYMNCRVDEVRIEAVARTANWVWANYQNQVLGQGFATYGTVSLNPPSGMLLTIW